MMKKLLLALMFFIYPNLSQAEIVVTNTGLITGIYSWGVAEVVPSLDGDTLITMPTGLTECPGGVYIKDSDYADRLLSMAMAAYLAKQTVRFQVWNDADRFWKGSSDNYCQLRSVQLRK
ncbi:hypothetical protein Q4491_04755 [Photobacterium sp. 2_MG-2023]|uniref:hypothetical protein n=1 Tax=Photobacterium sp. 2_MG-2023 TaxID=3062663 RepID=UPI0026E2D3BE|nr:hypothetical protein [Photobacterium sp. 2_MG-2023]MDO6580649.1 hypothetical protein [Photobacterium sp. 2_MG-2023]